MRQLVITNSVTRRDEKSLEKYFTEISKYEVLSPEEEIKLFERLKNGDEKALTAIVLHNSRFVVSVAKKYQHTGLVLGDLINEGNIGLIKAAHRFDITKGFKFISYAVWWIRQAILQAINEKGRKIRLPLNHQSNTSKIKKAEISFLQKTEREPTVDELAEATGLPINTILISLANYKKCRSLDAPLKADENLSLDQLIEDHTISKPDFNLVEKESNEKEVQSLLNKLSSREAAVISLYYGIERANPMTLDDIGNHIGITRERVRQIKDKGLRKLRRKHHIKTG